MWAPAIGAGGAGPANKEGRVFIHIGAAIILIAVMWFAIAYPAFRRFLVWVAVGIVGVIFLILMNSSLEESAQQRATAEREQHAEAQCEAEAAKLGCYHIVVTSWQRDPKGKKKWPSKFPPCPGDDTAGYVDAPSYASAEQERDVRERWEQLQAEEQKKAEAERQRQDAEREKRWVEHWQRQHETDRQQGCHKLQYDEFRYGAIAPIKWPFTFPPCDDSSPGGYTDVPTRSCVSGLHCEANTGNKEPSRYRGRYGGLRSRLRKTGSALESGRFW